MVIEAKACMKSVVVAKTYHFVPYTDQVGFMDGFDPKITDEWRTEKGEESHEANVVSF